MRLDDQIEALATRQHSLVAAWQLYGLGASRTEVDRIRQGRRWSTLTPRVLALRGSPATVERDLMAAVLDASPGAVVSQASSAALWGAPGCRPLPIHVLRHRGIARRTSPLCRVHEVVDLLPSHVRLIRGIPLTSPARTVFDLAYVFHPNRLERLLDWFWSERLLDGTTLDRTVAELAERGRSGSTLMRELAEVRGPTYVPPSSALERRFEQVLAERCLPPMRRQVNTGGEQWSGRVDYRDQHLPLVVEVQSERHHAALVDRAADTVRRTRLEDDGFEVIEVWDTEVWHDADVVADRVRAARRRLAAGRRTAG